MKIFAKLRQLLVQQLKKGATPHGLALSCALAVVLGLFPILGTTTALCFIVGAALGLNVPLMQFVNYVLAPIHLLSIPVYIYLGEALMGSQHISINPEVMAEQFRTDLRAFWMNFGMLIVYGIVAWALSAPVLGGSVYFITKRLLKNRFKNI